MQGFVQKTVKRGTRYFLAGLLAILPLVITVAVIAWVADLARTFIGPETMVGKGIRGLGLQFVSDSAVAYVLGAIVVLGVVFVIGVAVEAGARNLFERIADGFLKRIPIVGNLYGTSRQLVALFDRKDDNQMKGMQVVFCFFGGEANYGILALLVSPDRYRINDRDYQVVIIPTAPVPVGGGLFFVAADHIQTTEISVDGLMSIYVSMGITTPQFLPKNA